MPKSKHKKVQFKFITVLLALAIFVGSSCRKNELDPDPVDLGYNYFPTAVGSTWIYKVDSVVYDGYSSSGKIDTVVYWVKIAIEGEFIDNIGVKNQNITKYISTDSAKTFQFVRNTSWRIANYRAEVSDSSGKHVKLVFPATLYAYWDGNLFNAKQAEEYQIIDKKAKETVNKIVYDSTVHVLQRDVEFFIQKRYGLEKYAKNVGLIYRSSIDWDIEIKDNVSKKDGYDCTYTLIRFEK